MINKIIGLSSIIAVASMLVLPLSSQALPLNHREKCYGLQVCKTNPQKCKKDKNGLYQIKKMRACNRAGGHIAK